MAKEAEKPTNKTFVLSDESLNSYGFWVKTSGIDTKQFKKNPIMLWGHHRTYRGTTDEVLPIGVWENIRVEDGLLKADAIFDMEDEFAAKIASKVERGILRMCSVGIDILATDEVDLKPNQKRGTISKSRLREVSIVDIGSNDNALVLYNQDGKRCELSATGGIPVALLNNKKENKMEEILKQLNLSTTATQDDAVAAVLVLQSDQKTLSALQAQLKADQESRIALMVDNAIKEGKLMADKKETFVSIGTTSGEASLSAALSAISIPVKPSTVLTGKVTGEGVKIRKWEDFTAAELKEFKESDHDHYALLYKDHYGIDLPKN